MILVGAAVEKVYGMTKVWEPSHVISCSSIEQAVLEACDLIMSHGYCVAVSVSVRRALIAELCKIASAVALRSDKDHVEHYNSLYLQRAGNAIADLSKDPEMVFGENGELEEVCMHEVCVSGLLSVWQFHIYSKFYSLLA